ncbi:hypothetical protein GCK32_007990 [Trichostrongylus colubriformis]|uniref:Uncharacterized protein n=1 Tax=Trichostrongylus colubriformis TaxID=6319 RepID=A0AAN8FUJ2_TRICO
MALLWLQLSSQGQLCLQEDVLGTESHKYWLEKNLILVSSISQCRMDSPLSRPNTPDDWNDLCADEDDISHVVQNRKDVNEELREVKSLLEDMIEESVDSNVIREQKASQQYGKELQLQIEQMERAPRPPFETINHLRQRIERTNELYRRQFVWQMENMIRFTTDA